MPLNKDRIQTRCRGSKVPWRRGFGARCLAILEQWNIRLVVFAVAVAAVAVDFTVAAGALRTILQEQPDSLKWSDPVSLLQQIAQ
jgi:hypothetical protein